MKRLLRISLDIFLASIIPIASWFILSIIVDSRLLNVFTLTYPIQFIFGILKAIFATGANINEYKGKSENAVLSSMVIGALVGAVIFSLFAIFVDNYIEFMNMEVEVYREFCIYSIIQIYLQLLLVFVLTKLYYENKNIEANKYSVTFNLLNIIILTVMALITKDKALIVIITLVILGVYVFIIFIKQFRKFKLSFHILKNIRYNSVEVFTEISYFIIFLFGFSNALNYGKEYTNALTFATLITDMQWDITYAIPTVALIDISKGKFNYKEHLKNAYRLTGILIITMAIMLVSMYSFYEVNILLVLMFLSFDLINFILEPIYKLKTCYLQLEYSPVKITVNKIVSNIIRIMCSFLPTVFCTGIGKVASMLYQLISVNIIFKKNFRFDKIKDKIINKKEKYMEMG